MTMLRRGGLLQGDFDDSALTVEGVASTFSAVWRRDAKGPYVERLSPEGLDLRSMNSKHGIPLPLLDGHQQGSARAVIGAALNFRIEEIDGRKKLLASLRFSQADDVAPIIQRVREKTLTGLSIGYSVLAWEESREGPNRVRTAKRWEINELSVVAIPADPDSRIRRKSSMEPEELENTPPANDNRTETRAAIRQIARTAGLDAAWADSQIDNDATVIEARAAAFEAMQTRSAQTPRIRIVGASGDDPAVIRRRREDALFARVSGTAPEEHAREYVNDSLRDHARAILEANGVSTRGMSADTLFQRAQHTTSDFSQLLTGTGNRFLQAAYQAAESPLKQLARQATIADFRAKTTLKLSGIANLQEVSESGEIKSTTRGESSESYRLKTYASMFGISRTALINDDLGAFADWGRVAGEAAAATEGQLLADLLLSNPVMSDGIAMFATAHGNADIAAADDYKLSLQELSKARVAMRRQVGLDNKTPIKVSPSHWLVAPEHETYAQMLVSEIAPGNWTESNPFAGKLTVLTDPRLTPDKWYLFDKAIPNIEYAYLAGAPGPQLSSREGWDVLGSEYRVVLDFGAGAVDHRGGFMMKYE